MIHVGNSKSLKGDKMRNSEEVCVIEEVRLMEFANQLINILDLNFQNVMKGGRQDLWDLIHDATRLGYMKFQTAINRLSDKRLAEICFLSLEGGQVTDFRQIPTSFMAKKFDWNGSNATQVFRYMATRVIVSAMYEILLTWLHSLSEKRRWNDFRRNYTPTDALSKFVIRTRYGSK